MNVGKHQNPVGGFFDPVEPFGGGFRGFDGLVEGFGQLHLGADALNPLPTLEKARASCASRAGHHRFG
ncbi:hypothetical protein MKK84_29645 [Methylobacterium sp. E-065]|uniref:hypothetical protein n=1 Tax=Methylobacterium sp. E-065 TaxID=2836583 RepID=UPI001FBA90F0|nr:hypothetical protein [Methylobacterium sp. E-065]MCJ2021533.1 hypothetical protein [Methylobacterium sp. E-065]